MDLLRQLSGHWWAWMGPMLWQSSLLVVVVGTIDLLIRRWAWPQVRYVLWLLVLVKLLLPPTWSAPTGVVPRLQRQLAPGLEFSLGSAVRDAPIDGDANAPAWLQKPPSAAEAVPTLDTAPAVSGDAPRATLPGESALDWRIYAFATWLVGALAFAALLAFRYAALRRWHDHERQGQTIPPWYHELLVRTARRLGLGRLPAIVFSDRLLTPAVCGMVRPVMYLPRDYLEKLTPAEAEHVLLHELAHLKRYDHWRHALGMFVQVVYWPNPFVMLARKNLQHVGEICTDMTVAAVLREQSAGYRQTLLDTARRLLTESAAPGLGLLGVFEEPFRLVTRLRWLEKPTWRNRWAAQATAAAVATAMLAFVMPMAGGTPEAGALADGPEWSFGVERSGEFVYVVPGTFTMGSPVDEPGRSSDEGQHDVTLTHGLYVQATEVTNRQYTALAQWAYDQGHVTVDSDGLRDNLDGSTELLLRMNTGTDIAFGNGVFRCLKPDHPARSLTWYGSAAYCDWLSLRQGLPRAYDHADWQCNAGEPQAAVGYRLPTEAEWEYTCRAGSATAFANGPITHLACSPVDPTLDQVGWYCGNAGDGTHPVAQKLPNAWGLYDMHGNVYEWCNDWGNGAFTATATDPAGPTKPTGCRTIRGGNFVLGNGAEFCRSAFRNWFLPDRIGEGAGCRVVRTALGEKAAMPTAPPQLTVLSPPTPNPFNPSTVIRYSLPRATHVTIAVYDPRGGRVRVLLDAVITVGEQSVEWDGSDERGVAVAAGIYLVRLQTEDGIVRVQKMTLAK